MPINTSDSNFSLNIGGTNSVSTQTLKNLSNNNIANGILNTNIVGGMLVTTEMSSLAGKDHNEVLANPTLGLKVALTNAYKCIEDIMIVNGKERVKYGFAAHIYGTAFVNAIIDQYRASGAVDVEDFTLIYPILAQEIGKRVEFSGFGLSADRQEVARIFFEKLDNGITGSYSDKKLVSSSSSTPTLSKSNSG